MPKQRVVFLAPKGMDVSPLEKKLDGDNCDLYVHTSDADHKLSDEEIIEAVRDADVIILYNGATPRQVIDRISPPKAIISCGHGYNHIDDNAATEKGIMVVNCAGLLSEEVSNHTIMLLLACAKQLTILDQLTRQGIWSQKLSFSFPPIYGQTLGIIALGNIGRATARKAKMFGLNIIAYDPYLPPWIAKDYGVELVPTLQSLASRSDFVSLNTPLNRETKNLIGSSFFKSMKNSAYFINTARGDTVNEQDLIQALKNAEIAGAGLDVFENEPTPTSNPLLKMENVIVTPHTAGGSVNSIPHALERVGEETSRILSGKLPMSLVNPEVIKNIRVHEKNQSRNADVQKPY